ncbi:MAG: polysaccharide deacetylase family protein [Clostridia bacterium]|nr:polysaccharide deacetylase family protein [Clostridia bacterium]
MIQFNVYPGGVRRIVTFSYDDGHENDARLIELFNKYGVKATFHLNGIKYLGMSDAETEAVRKLYLGHEISCHTLRHGKPANMADVSVVNETLEDRKILERIAGYPVVGMSYPSGSFSKRVIEILSACGIVYSRTTLATQKFSLPENFLTWHPTCHHRDALPLCPKFMESLDSEWTSPLFYIWGHAHELRTPDDWAYMEEIIKSLAGSDKIWYATNIEFYDYKTAQRALRISADEKILFNPTAIDVWVEKDKVDVIRIPAGQTVYL